MIAGDAHRIEVAHLLVDEILLNVTHHSQGKLGAKDAGVLCLIFLQNVGLNSATHGAQGFFLDLGIDLGLHQLITGDAEQAQAQSFIADRQRTAVLRSRPTGEEGLHLVVCGIPAGLISAQIFLYLLINRRVHEHRQNDWRRPVDGH